MFRRLALNYVQREIHKLGKARLRKGLAMKGISRSNLIWLDYWAESRSRYQSFIERVGNMIQEECGTPDGREIADYLCHKMIGSQRTIKEELETGNFKGIDTSNIETHLRRYNNGMDDMECIMDSFSWLEYMDTGKRGMRRLKHRFGKRDNAIAIRLTKRLLSSGTDYTVDDLLERIIVDAKDVIYMKERANMARERLNIYSPHYIRDVPLLDLFDKNPMELGRWYVYPGVGSFDTDNLAVLRGEMKENGMRLELRTFRDGR